MNIKNALMAVAMVTTLSANVPISPPEERASSISVYSHQAVTENHDKIRPEKPEKDCDRENHDPLKMLEEKKSKIRQKINSGEITKEKGEEIIKKIDNRIKEIKEFNSLSLPKKREKLIGKFKEKLDNKVKDGTLTRQKADEYLEKFTEQINQWDGNGYPKIKKDDFKELFDHKNEKHKHHHR